MIIEPAYGDDFKEVHALAERIEGIVGHPVHLYKILMDHFGDFFLVARIDGETAGFQQGFPSVSREGAYFLWQVGVSPDFRKRGVASALVKETEKVAASAGCTAVEATVETVNYASQGLFESLGYVVASYGDTIEVEGKRAMPDFYGSGTDQILYKKSII
ncbi:GNAT family N-acetyltransferase [Candidatus Fermentibacteria bacterium]|nr:GNAT family N-acetyltransferase [Candidatus Fermentibacteria bacterium]